jgi:hypothetical protein
VSRTEVPRRSVNEYNKAPGFVTGSPKVQLAAETKGKRWKPAAASQFVLEYLSLQAPSPYEIDTLESMASIWVQTDIQTAITGEKLADTLQFSEQGLLLSGLPFLIIDFNFDVANKS